MGSCFTKKAEARFVMTGLDDAGKTTLLYRLKLGEVLPHANHTIGFNVETIEHNGFSYIIYDVGGGDKIKPIWTQTFKDTDGVIIVVDSHDRERIGEVKDMLRREDEAREHGETVFLIFANKQDKPDAMSAKEIEEKLDTQSLRNRTWHVQASSATGESAQELYEGLDWLASQLTAEKLTKIRSHTVK